LLGRGLRVAAIVLGLCAAGTVLAQREPSDPHAELLYADHGSPGPFFNPWTTSRRSLWRILKWQFSSNPYDKGRPVDVPVVENDGAYLSGVEPGATATWVGHATFAIHEGDDVFLTDPHFSKRALLPARVVPPGVPIGSIPDDAFAVISHAHYDHLDRGTVTGLPDTVHWFVPLGLAEWFRDRGRPRVVELDWWESAQHGRFTITCLPSQHWSLRFGQRENSTLWCSWLIDSGERRYYFAGDTGYFHGFREFAKRFGPIDVAMLPIGAYEPRWFMQDQHMDPAEAYQAFQDLGARFMLPMHWGTFDLTDEPVDEAPIELTRVLGEAGDERVHLFAIGERWQIPEPEPR
jgi:N-acyl-phosphatidylethanolamine-hydrolysing phospholipase D